MKKPPAKGRIAKPSGMLTKLLGQTVPRADHQALTLAQAQSSYEAAVALYHRAEWDQAEQQPESVTRP